MKALNQAMRSSQTASIDSCPPPTRRLWKLRLWWVRWLCQLWPGALDMCTRQTAPLWPSRHLSQAPYDAHQSYGAMDTAQAQPGQQQLCMSLEQSVVFGLGEVQPLRVHHSPWQGSRWRGTLPPEQTLASQIGSKFAVQWRPTMIVRM